MAKAKIIDGWYIEGKKPVGWEKRGVGSYRLTVSYEGADGKTIIKKETYKTSETTPSKLANELAAERARFLDFVQNNVLRTGDELTFKEYVEEYWIPEYASDRDRMTVRNQQETVSALKKRVYPYIGNMKINAIKKTHLDALIASMRKEDLKVSSIKRYLTMISSVLSWAYEKEVISDNPCHRIRFRTSDTKQMHVFNADQVKCFLDALQMTYQKRTTVKETVSEDGQKIKTDWYEDYRVSTMYQAFFTMAITSGFRRGELCALCWRDIDLNKREVNVTKSLSKVESVSDSDDELLRGGLMVKGPKNTSSVRKVPLTATSVAFLKHWKVEEKMLSNAWDNGKDFEDNYVFVQTDTGIPVYPDSVSSKFKDIIQMYNAQCTEDSQKLPMLHLHELRHTCATQLLLNGTPAVVVAKILGHSKVSTTEDIYGNHEDPDAMAAAIMRLDKIASLAV